LAPPIADVWRHPDDGKSNSFAPMSSDEGNGGEFDIVKAG